MSARRLIVFARLPVAGRVKTRLATTIGVAAALDAHRRLLAATLHLAERCAIERREFRFDRPEGPLPDEALALPEALAAAGWEVAPQQGADLGERMQHALGAALATGDRPVLIGSDCPELTVSDIDDAFGALRSVDAAFAPAEDGGYALVGVSRPLPAIFERMAWGTAAVMADTLTRLREAGATWRELRTVRDVDRAADWERWLRIAPDGWPGRP